MKEKLIVGLTGLALLALGLFAPDILDVIVEGRPTELQVAAGTAIPLGLGFLLLSLLGRAWFNQ